MHLAAGLSVGLAGVAAGYTIGIVGDAVRVFPPLSTTGVSLTAMSSLGRAGIHATITGLRGDDSDSDFWRSSGALRVCLLSFFFFFFFG